MASQLDLVVMTVDHDALVNDDVPAAVRRVRSSGNAIYRGWMLRAEHYTAMHRALEEQGVSLRTSPEFYRAAHHLPGWYECFRAHTPMSSWTTTPDLAAGLMAASQLPPGPAVIKDYVKSMKHYWNEAVLISDTTNADEVRRVVMRFLELRGSDFEGGLVFRRFESLTGPEVRTWWRGSECILITPHPDHPDAEIVGSVPTEDLVPAVHRLDSPFITVDMAQDQSGRWWVVEVGDGQVSDRPSTTPPDCLLRPLFKV